jgi:hypothetical protein
MAYTDIPLAPQRIKDSQPLIRQNFIEIDNLIDVDHYTFGSPTAGEHKKVTLPDQGLAPAFPAGDVGLFARIPTAPYVQTGVNEIFLNRSDGNKIPFSAAEFNNPGWSYLPSGILLKWGNATINGAGTVIFPAAANIAAFSLPPFAIFFTPITVGGDPDGFVSLNIVGLTNLSFNVFCSSRTFPGAANVPFLYFAIGV